MPLPISHQYITLVLFCRFRDIAVFLPRRATAPLYSTRILGVPLGVDCRMDGGLMVAIPRFAVRASRGKKYPVDQGFFKSQFTTAQGMTSMASAEREPITGVWGQSPHRGSRGQSPRWGSGGRSPLKLKAFLLSHAQRKPQI